MARSPLGATDRVAANEITFRRVSDRCAPARPAAGDLDRADGATRGLALERARAVRGEARFSPASRALYVNDASVDRQVPIGVRGAFGIASAACAWYTSFAITANHTTRRDWIPVGEARSVQQDTGEGDGRS